MLFSNYHQHHYHNHHQCLSIRAARLCIAEVENLVQPGELDPEDVHLPGIYVHRIVKGERYSGKIEKRTTRKRAADTDEASSAVSAGAQGMINICIYLSMYVCTLVCVCYTSKRVSMYVGTLLCHSLHVAIWPDDVYRSLAVVYRSCMK